jgi:hypothetical protein
MLIEKDLKKNIDSWDLWIREINLYKADEIIHGGGFSQKEKEEVVDIDIVISNLLMTIYMILCQKIITA